MTRRWKRNTDVENVLNHLRRATEKVVFTKILVFNLGNPPTNARMRVVSIFLEVMIVNAKMDMCRQMIRESVLVSMIDYV